LDADSPESEFKEHLIPELIASASRGEAFVTVEALLRAVVPYWDVYGADAKRQLVRKARDVLVRTVDRDFPKDFKFEAGGTKFRGDTIRIVGTPAAYDPRGQTQAWQRLQRRAARAVGRPKRQDVAPGQQILFEELGLGIDTEA
jgi:hypothetical protein